MLIKKKINGPISLCIIVWLEVSAHAFCALTHTKVDHYSLRKILSWVYFLG